MTPDVAQLIFGTQRWDNHKRFLSLQKLSLEKIKTFLLKLALVVKPYQAPIFVSCTNWIKLNQSVVKIQKKNVFWRHNHIICHRSWKKFLAAHKNHKIPVCEMITQAVETANFTKNTLR